MISRAVKSTISLAGRGRLMLASDEVTVSRLPALQKRTHVVLYNQIILFSCLRWMAGEDVSLFLRVLLGGDDRARRHTATPSWGNPAVRIAMLQLLCMQPAHACGNVNRIGCLFCASFCQ